jgi:aspartyl-tRNA(Asn)/glutamyl-tRNA(Gln) amidotransferase subunit A
VELTGSEFNNTYLKALHLRHLLRDELSRTFRIENVLSTNKARSEGVDLLLHPTAVQTAPLLSGRIERWTADRYELDGSVGYGESSVCSGQTH